MANRKNKQPPSKKAYDKEWNKNNTLCVAFRLSRINDQDLIEVYESIPNKMEWFRQALKDYGGIQ